MAADASIYSPSDSDVMPPVVIWPQQLGRIPGTERSEERALIEVVINSDGTVARVRAQQSPQTLDDAMILTMSLSAAKSWRFRPALKDGRPVRYRQLIPVSVR